MGLTKEIYKKVNELHHRYKKGERRMVIVSSINHTHSCDIFEYMNEQFLHILIVFLKKHVLF